MTTAQEGGKVVILTHWPPLPLGNPTGTHFYLQYVPASNERGPLSLVRSIEELLE